MGFLSPLPEEELQELLQRKAEERAVEKAETIMLGPPLFADTCPREAAELMRRETVRLHELAAWYVEHKFMRPEFDYKNWGKQLLCNQLAQARNRWSAKTANDTQPDIEDVDWTSEEAVDAYRTKVMYRAQRKRGY